MLLLPTAGAATMQPEQAGEGAFSAWVGGGKQSWSTKAVARSIRYSAGLETLREFFHAGSAPITLGRPAKPIRPWFGQDQVAEHGESLAVTPAGGWGG